MRRGSRRGIDWFIDEEGAYTTVAAAVSILVVLTLLFSAITAVWTLSRAGDVQTSADATALAGANVVSSYHTTATVLDATILSLGLAGFCTENSFPKETLFEAGRLFVLSRLPKLPTITFLPGTPPSSAWLLIEP